jgi:hypothetical protein
MTGNSAQRQPSTDNAGRLGGQQQEETMLGNKLDMFNDARISREDFSVNFVPHLREFGASDERIEEIWHDWKNKTPKEILHEYLQRVVKEQMQKRMLPGFVLDDDKNETYMKWPEFKREVIELAGELEGRTNGELMSAIVAKFQVTPEHQHAIKHYAWQAMLLREKAIKGEPAVDSLPQDKAVCFGERRTWTTGGER